MTGLASTLSEGPMACMTPNKPIPVDVAGSRRTAARVTPGANVFVDHTAKRLEETGRALHLIDHDEAVRTRSEVGASILQPRLIGGIFQVEIVGTMRCTLYVLCDGPCQCRLPDLARA